MTSSFNSPNSPPISTRTMRVRKRDGSTEPVDVNRIVSVVEQCAEGLAGIDPMRVAARTISGLADGASTVELDRLAIRTAASLIVEEPNYTYLAARLLAREVEEETSAQGLDSFTAGMAAAASMGLLEPATAEFIGRYGHELEVALDQEGDRRFTYFGLRTVADRYLLRHPETRALLERPQWFLLRVACGLATIPEEALELYPLLARLDYLPSSPTLFNSGTSHPQMSSCYLLDSPSDNLEAIYRRYTDVAMLSKHAGGIGLAFSRVRSRGSLIKGTNGLSNGIMPFLKTLDSSVAAVNQGGRRKGAACVYLEPWHADVEELLEARNNTGDPARRTHNLNVAHWIPDLFMQRVEQDGKWSLFDPKAVPEFVDLHGEAFTVAYKRAESEGRYVKQLKARDLYGRMMRMLAETGNGWMCFKDASNRTCNQARREFNTVHLSNLCTEIVEVTDADHIAVCNLGSINLARFVTVEDVDRAELGPEQSVEALLAHMDLDRLETVTGIAVRYLDRVIDRNLYPVEDARRSNEGWRPVGLGVMGLQDVLYALRVPFDAPVASTLSARLTETIYLSALDVSCRLAQEAGSPHTRWDETYAAQGRLQPDLWGVATTDARWPVLRQRIATYGLRNSLLIAIAPTATIASIAGCHEGIEPAVANLFKRETLSGEFLQINTHLVRDLQTAGRWDATMVERLKATGGSIQEMDDLADELRTLYRTAWELPMRALIDAAAERGPFIDQSQSLNLFQESPTIGRLSSMYLHAWKQGLKTTYYLRSRPATRITGVAARSTTSTAVPVAVPSTSDHAAVACSLENPETCEACD